MSVSTYAQRIHTKPRVYHVGIVFGAALLIALSAQVRVPLPFSPVPVTGQTFVVLLLGALLGARRGASAALTYVTLGVIGLPVFAGGNGGPLALLGPTGGYLLGFVAAAYVTGWLIEREPHRRAIPVLLALLLGNLTVYACGLPWLAVFVGGKQVLALGFLPFLVGDLAKIVSATALLSIEKEH